MLRMVKNEVWTWQRHQSLAMAGKARFAGQLYDSTLEVRETYGDRQTVHHKVGQIVMLGISQVSYSGACWATQS